MKVPESFYQLKNETLALVVALQDPSRLDRVATAMKTDAPASKVLVGKINVI